MTFDDLPVALQNALTLGAVGFACYCAGGFTAWLMMHHKSRKHALRAVKAIFGGIHEDDRDSLGLK